jgi:hypothetical protein
MKRCGFVLLALILAGSLLAGCTQNPLPSVIPASTAPASTTPPAATTTLQPSFTLGDIYLNDPYGYVFDGTTMVIERSFIVDSPSWGILLKVTPRNGDPTSGWFTMNVTNTNTQKTDLFGYGGNFSLSQEQLIPMYNMGPYKITMKGSGVKVFVTVAKRKPPSEVN